MKNYSNAFVWSILVLVCSCKKTDTEPVSDDVGAGISAGVLVVPPTPPNWSNSAVAHLTESNLYNVEVKVNTASTYQDCFVYKTDNYSSTVNGSKRLQASASFTNFSFDPGTSVTVKITVLSGIMPTSGNVKIRPLDYALAGTVSGNTITFTLNTYRKISVEVGNRLNPLFIFADALPPAIPGSGVKYFQPGSHSATHLNNLPENTVVYEPGIHIMPKGVNMPSGKTMIIKGGAVIQGSFKIANGCNYNKILGRGIISNGDLPTLGSRTGPNGGDYRDFPSQATFRGSDIYEEVSVNNLTWDGITIVNTGAINFHFVNTKHTIHHNTWKNLKLLAWNGNSDAIWYDGDDNKIEDCFIFNNDDVTTTRGSNRATISNLVFWGGQYGGHLLYHDDYASSNGITYSNIQSIGVDKCEEVIWAMSRSGKVNTIENITFKDMRFEERIYNASDIYSVSKFIKFELQKNSCNNWLFENVRLDNQNPDEGDIFGTPNANISVTFKNFRFWNGSSYVNYGLTGGLGAMKMDKNSYATVTIQ